MTLSQRYRRVYAALKALGLSPTKALEVLYDAKRGDPIGLAYARLAACIGRSR